jgi:CheY-like chemotaxis protein
VPENRPPRSVLVADDDPAVEQVLAMAFRKSGYEVDTAKDGTAALGLVDRRAYDLLVLDILMPGATGWEVLARAVERASPGAALPSVILITGFNQEYVVDIRVLREEGVGAMLLKPFPASDILAEAERLLAEAPRTSLPRAGQKTAP